VLPELQMREHSKKNLINLFKLWPGTPETVKASEIIAYLNQKIPELKIEEDKQIASEIYMKKIPLNMFSLLQL